VKAEMVVTPELCTRPDILHGGAVMAFADTLGAAATVLNLPGGQGHDHDREQDKLRGDPHRSAPP
jgi:acyl-coenzyme A thioesterase PaaI-like protein